RASRVVVTTAAQVGARAKRFALRCEHDRATAGVSIELLEGIRDLLDQAAIEEVVRRALNLHRCDRACERDADVLALRHVVAPGTVVRRERMVATNASDGSR